MLGHVKETLLSVLPTVKTASKSFENCRFETETLERPLLMIEPWIAPDASSNGMIGWHLFYFPVDNLVGILWPLIILASKSLSEVTE